MTTSRQMEFLSEILEWKPVPEDALSYFRERLRNRLHSAILDAFNKRAQGKSLKQSELAVRIHRTRAQITRWLGSPSNLTLDSVSDLMIGLAMDFDAFSTTPIEKTVQPQAGNRRAGGAKRASERIPETRSPHVRAAPNSRQ